MTPGARIAAAITLLDEIETGAPAERVLTRWARTNRYAGSKDRAAVRDHVFDVLRSKRSAAAFGAGSDGRAMMIGYLRQMQTPLEPLFSGEGHAPTELTTQELAFDPPTLSRNDGWNLPDWLFAEFETSLGTHAETTALALQRRAPVTLRVNTARIDRTAARDILHGDTIETEPNPLCETALTVTANPRKIRTSEAYNTGLVELQDASSQAVVSTLPAGGKVLDYCAGGGGKSLALAADPTRQVFAHDAYAARMRDLPFRASRAEANIEILSSDDVTGAAPFDVVVCDVPCSGSGAWRRNPDGKWALTPEKLDDLNALQAAILSETAPLVKADGMLCYVTCSVLNCENDAQVDAFLKKNPDWCCVYRHSFEVSEHGDGFFVAHLTHR